MACHYSCLSCSGNTYADLCLTCPTSRYLMDTTCLCNSGMYQYQSATCSTYDQIEKLDYTFNVIIQIVYFVMLAFSWVVVLANINHIYSAKIRVLITYSQLISLLLDYRFRFSSISQKALNVFSVWNFRYFNTLFCTNKSKPYQCNTYENLYGPIMTLIAFFSLLIISYILTKTCILSIFTENSATKNDQQVVIIKRGAIPQYKRYGDKQTSQDSSIGSMTFWQYMNVSIKPFILLYIDYTIIDWTVQISRIAYLSTYTFLIYVPIAFLLMGYLLYCLKTVNSASQFKIQYRSRLGYFYLYDQNYHLNYLDYLYQEERNSRLDRQYKAERYLPHSNYILFEIVMKFCIAATTIIMFQYKPQLWAFLFLFAMLIGLFKINIFGIYQRLALLTYFLGFVIYLISLTAFFTPYFFTIWMVIIMFISSTGYFLMLISDLSDWSKEKEGKYWKIAFQYLYGETQSQNQQRQQQENHLQSQHEESNDDLIKSKITQNQKSILSQNDIENKPNPMSNATKSLFAKSKLIFKKTSAAVTPNNSIKQNSKSFEPIPNVNQAKTQKQDMSNGDKLSQLLEGQKQKHKQKSNDKQSFMSRSNRSKFGNTSNKRQNSSQGNKKFITMIQHQQTGKNTNGFGRTKQLPHIEQQISDKVQNGQQVSIELNEKQQRSDDNLVVEKKREGKSISNNSKFKHSYRLKNNKL